MKPLVMLIALAFALMSCGSQTKTRTEYVPVETVREVEVEVIKEVPVIVEKVITVTKVEQVRDSKQEAILQATINQLQQVIDQQTTQEANLRALLAEANRDIEVILGIYAESLEENNDAQVQIDSLREEVTRLEGEIAALGSSSVNLQAFLDATVFTNLTAGDIQACIDHKAQYPAWGRCYISINR